jgi:hypothetical protein
MCEQRAATLLSAAKGTLAGYSVQTLLAQHVDVDRMIG